jgi:hypothetical protein
VHHYIRKLIWIASYPLLRRIIELEGLHSGQECYIFGDGSSIAKFDLSAFADKVGIAVNAFPRHRDAQTLNIRYWIVAEAGFFLPPLFRTPKNKARGYRNRVRFQSFYRRQPRDAPDLVQITSVSNLPGLRGKQTYYFWDQLPRRRQDCDTPRSSSMFAGSICAAVSLAHYLGFTKVFLVGIDNTHNPGTSHHWYENITPVASPQIPRTYHPEFFETMTKHIEIVTVTPTPQLTELPSVDYQSLTGRTLRDRKNVELLAREDLEVLALNPRYKVF